MTHPRISVSGICTINWDLDQDLAFWEEAGIDHVGIPYVKLEKAGWDAGAKRVRDAGLRVGNVIGAGFPLDRPSSWPKQQERLAAVIQTAAVVDATCLVLTTGPAGGLTWEAAADALADAIGPVLAQAAAADLPVCIEHTNSLRVDIGFVHTLHDALDLARRLGSGVCMEVNACWAERSLSSAISSGAELLRLVQLSDYVVPTLSTPNRAVPGDGHIPLADICAQVLGTGYGGAFDLEIVGPRIEEEGYPSAVRRSLAALSTILEVAGA